MCRYSKCLATLGKVVLPVKAGCLNMSGGRAAPPAENRLEPEMAGRACLLEQIGVLCRYGIGTPCEGLCGCCHVGSGNDTCLGGKVMRQHVIIG